MRLNFMKNSVQEPSHEPRLEYGRRLEALREKQTQYENQHRKLGIAKLALGGATFVLIGLALVIKLISVVWGAAPLFAIVVLAIVHDRVLKRLGRCSRAIAYYERGLARIDGRWMGVGETGERFASATHTLAIWTCLATDRCFSSYVWRAPTPARKRSRTGWSRPPRPRWFVHVKWPLRSCDTDWTFVRTWRI
jgi:hypothetical protein